MKNIRVFKEENDPRKNSEGYPDPTAYDALRRVEAAQNPALYARSQEYDRFKKLLKIIYKLCDLCDFSIEERIVVRDNQTGRIWR